MPAKRFKQFRNGILSKIIGEGFGIVQAPHLYEIFDERERTGVVMPDRHSGRVIVSVHEQYADRVARALSPYRVINYAGSVTFYCHSSAVRS